LEVSDPSMSVLAEGFFIGGLKLFISYVFYKIKDASNVILFTAPRPRVLLFMFYCKVKTKKPRGASPGPEGEKNNTYLSYN